MSVPRVTSGTRDDDQRAPSRGAHALEVVAAQLREGATLTSETYSHLKSEGCDEYEIALIAHQNGVLVSAYLKASQVDGKSSAAAFRAFTAAKHACAQPELPAGSASELESPIVREPSDGASEKKVVDIARGIVEQFTLDVRGFKASISAAYEEPVFGALCLLADQDPAKLKQLLAELKKLLRDRKAEIDALALRIRSHVNVQLTSLEGRSPRSVKWAWDQRVPAKTLTLMVGTPGKGKSTFLGDLLARATRGELEGDLHGRAVDVVICTAEDPVDEVLVPRLIAGGADRARVHIVEMKGDAELMFPHDLDALARQIKAVDAKMLILDPVVAYIDGAIDAHKDQHVRQVLGPIAKMAEGLNIAVVAVMHLNKANFTDVLSRVGGSVGFVAAARSVLFLGQDPENADDDSARVLAHAKSNFGALAPSLRFRVVDRTGSVVTDDGETPQIGGIEWVGECEISAEKLLSGFGSDDDHPTARKEAGAWIVAMLADAPRAATFMLEEGPKAVGCGVRTFKSAKSDVGVETFREGTGWTWSMPTALSADDWPLPH